MEIPRTKITQADWLKLAIGRATYEQRLPDTHIRRADITIPLNYDTILNANKGVVIADLHFSDCVFFEPIYLGDYSSSGRISFVNCEFRSPVVVEKLGHINLDATSFFRSDLNIKSMGPIQEIAGLNVDGTLTIVADSPREAKISAINKDRTKQRIAIYLDGPKLTLNSCHADSLFVGGRTDAVRVVSVNGCHANKLSLDADYENCFFDVHECEVGKLQFFGPEKGEISLLARYSTCRIVMDLDYANIRSAIILYSNIKKLSLKAALKKECSSEIENSTIETLVFDRFSNEGKLSLRNVTVPAGGTLGIASSNMGKAEFILCNFAEASWDFENSRLTEVFVAETEFPKKVRSNKKNDHGQAQLAFGQLRTAFDKQGDTARALEYQAREIEALYYDIASYWRKEPPFLHFTKLNLGLNRLSNNFGRDWGRGVLFSVAAGLLCFSALVWTTQEYTLHGHWQFDTRLIASFARFMNPLRFFDLEMLFSQNNKEPYVKLSWGSYVLDFLGRVVVAYGYYQTIQAFRRYGRK